MSRWAIIGGAGFIGSHLVGRLLAESEDSVVVYDNFCSGHEWHLADFAAHERLRVIRGDVGDSAALTSAVEGAEVVVHLAANADIAAAASDPGIDFWHGTYLTHQVLEAARQVGASAVIYSSGSGVYGDQGDRVVDETFGPLLPISTYGASKLAGEGLVSSYCHLFGMRGAAFRFANVVGPRQTHGVTYDFVRKLRSDPSHLAVLGDGSQSKSYLHVEDVIDAVLLLSTHLPPVFDVFNVGTDEYVTVKEIADLVIAEMGLSAVHVEFGSTPRGWTGDVPVVRFASNKIRTLGWSPRYSSADALRTSIHAVLAEAQRDLDGEHMATSSDK